MWFMSENAKTAETVLIVLFIGVTLRDGYKKL
jgi:hypothetical protein